MARPSRLVSVGERYSRFVGIMKLMLPLSATVLVIIVVAWPYLNGRHDGVPLSFAGIGVGLDENIFMTKARYMGSDDNDQPYTLTAERMVEEDSVDNAIRLTKLEADIMLNDGTWLAMTSDTGVLYRDIKKLALEGSVSFFSDAGYEFRTKRADLYLATKRAVGDQPIEGQGPYGTLNADSFRLEDRGATIIFEGNVRMIFFPGVAAQ